MADFSFYGDLDYQDFSSENTGITSWIKREKKIKEISWIMSGLYDEIALGKVIDKNQAKILTEFLSYFRWYTSYLIHDRKTIVFPYNFFYMW